MKFNKNRASRAVAYVMSAIMISQALLSPTSMVYANAGDAASQQETTQVENSNGGGYDSSENNASEQGASGESAAVDGAATADVESAATASADGQSDDAAPATSTWAAGESADQSDAAAQNVDAYNPNADPIIIDGNTSSDDVTVDVGLYTDADHKNELGDTAIGANDTIYANVSMKFDKHVKPSKSNPTVKYVFPDSLKVTNGSGTGPVVNGKTMYTWSIKDNVFTVQFTEAFFEEHNSEIYTKADFNFKLDADKVGDDGKLDVKFPGTGTTVTINQKEGNVDGKKTCELGADGKTVSYTVELNPETNVTDFKLVDQLGNGLSYNNDFKLDGWDVSAAVVGNTATIHLDKLSKGSHKLTYTATINPKALDNLKPGENGNAGMNTDAFKNKAKWTWSGKPEGNTSETNPNASFDLIKSKKSTKKDNGTYEWTVDLNTGKLKADMSGYKFTDTLEDSDALQYVGSYKVIDVTDDNKEIDSGSLDATKGSFDYTFGSDAKDHEYKIVYSTKVKDGAVYGTYKNKATVDDGKGDKDKAEGSIGYKPAGTVDVKKEITKEVDANGFASWKTTIGLSKLASDCDITKAYFCDFTGEGYKGADENIWFENDGDLKLVADGKELVEGADYNVTWRNSSSQWDYKATGPEAKNWGLKIVFTEKAQSLVGKTDVEVTYRTKCANKAGTYKNTAKFNDGYGNEPSDSKTYEIESKDSTTKSGKLKWDPDFDWSKIDASDTTKGAWVASWTVKANYLNSGKTNWGQYGLNDTAGNPIHIEDDLAGMTYVPGSGSYTVQANYGNNANGEKCKETGSFDAKVTDGVLAAEIPTADVFDGKGKGTHYVWAQVEYKTAVKATTEQKDLSFTNHVTSGAGDDSYGGATATVTGKQSITKKTADYSENNNRVEYTVNVNDQAQDLVSGSDTVDLTDTLTGKAELVIDSIKVVDASGKALDASEWAYSIEQGSDADGDPTTTLKFTLPDSRKLKVSYTVSLIGQVGESGILKNSAELAGSKAWSSDRSQKYTVVKSHVDAGGIASSISIVKQDGTGSHQNLAGAKFALYKVQDLADLKSGSREDLEKAGKLVKTQTSDEKGKITFGGEGDSKLETATLYYFKEIASPTGYIKNDTITCVVLKGASEEQYGKIAKQLNEKGVKFETTSSFTRYNTPTSEGKAEFKARKVLDGKKLVDGEFTFVATDADGNEVAHGTNDADGNVTLKGDKLSWDKEGKYTYTIKEVKGTESGVTYSKDSYKAVVTVERDGTYGPLRATVEYQNADGTKLDASALPTFTNTYKKPEATPVTAKPSVKKEISGAPAGYKMQTGAFTFQLEQTIAPEGVALNADQTKSNDADGNVAFDKLVFAKAGEYTFKLSETAVDAEKAPGVSKSNEVYTITYEVTADKDGNLSVANKTVKKGDEKVASDDANIPFTNTYTVSGNVSVDLKAQKEFTGEGAELKAEEFQFELKGDADANGEVSQVKTNNADGNVSFGKLTFDKVGTYKYTVSEVVPDGAVDGLKGGVTYDRSVYHVTVKVADNGEGGLKQTTTIEKDGAEVGSIDFRNAYQKTKPVDVSLSAEKTVNGAVPSDAQKFSFDLNKSNENGDKGELVETAQNKGGEVSFKKFAYTDAADEWYVISEQPKDGFNCDSKVVKAHVVVTKGNDNQLTSKVTYIVDGEKSSDPVKFENTVAPVTTTLKVKKLVNGDSSIATDRDFTFSLHKAGNDGKPTGDELATAAAKPGETVKFNNELSFSEVGTYQYVIEETSEAGNGISNADSVIATVMVVAADNGALSVKSVTYTNATEKDGTGAALFDNTYTATGSATVKVQKTVNGNAPASDQTFDFALTPVDGAPMPGGAESLTAQTVGGEAASFPELTYALKDAGKTYEYEISETTPATVGWTMAKPVTVKVTVGADQGDGTLGAATVECSNTTDGGSAAAFDNKYEQASGEFQLALVKTVSGEVPLKGETFEFSATAEDDNAEDAPKFENVTTGADGAATFEAVKLSDKDAGKTYTYRIHEVTDPKDGKGAWTKAADVIATVKVGERSADNKLTATVTYRSVDSHDEYADAAQFDNTFKPTAVPVQVKVKKATVNGKTDVKTDETYTFGLYKKGADGQAEGKAIDTVSGKLGETLAFAADKLTYGEAGTHEYLIREETHNGSKGWGAVADVPVTVTVAAKGGDGSDARDLTATVKYGDSDETHCASFADTYTATGSATLKVNKIVNGGKDKAEGETFEFALKDESDKELSRTTVAAGETAEFAPIDYTLADAGKTFTYTISEVGHNSGRWFKAGDVTATVKVSDNDNGTLKIEVSYSNSNKEKTAALFDNTHVAPAKAELKVSKTVNGAKEDAAKEKFAFELMGAKEDAPMPASSELIVEGTGTGSFGEISYSEPGTYEYAIHETSDLGAGWKNAKDVVATVTVERDETAKTLEVTKVEYSNATEDQLAAAFDNTYTVKGTEISLEATKVLKGAELKAGQFEFQLKDADGKVLQTAKNDKDGKVSFDPISYEASDLDARGASRDFEYAISEVVPADVVDGVKDGITYDTTEHKVKVHVSDDGTSGQLGATVTYDGDARAPMFTNTYSPKEEKPHEDTPKGGSSTHGGMPTTGDTTTMVVSVIATAGLCALASGLRLARRKRD